MFTEDLKLVGKALENFYKESVNGDEPVLKQQQMCHIMRELEFDKYLGKGGLNGPDLEQFLEKYLRLNTRLHHPRYLGHQCAAPHYSAALGTFINAFTNNVTSIYEMGPASVSMEYYLINWMLRKIGWTPAPLCSDEMNKYGHGGGVLVNGGSLANLTALILARSKCAPETWTEGSPSELCILLPSESHYSISRAVGILGMGSKAIYALEVDSEGAVIPDRLPETYGRIIEDGKRPMALVANACSTPAGIYDPIDEIADFCEQHHLWLHIDGAHGASALLSDKFRYRLDGVGRADSLVWDAHKLLQAPSLCAALLVKDHRNLDGGLFVGENASYLFHEKEQPGFDFINRMLETTKSGLGEKLFFVLAAIGEEGMASFIDRQYDLTLAAYDYIQQQPDFACPVRPQSNILCFEYLDKEASQIEIRKELIAKGDFYLTTTIFKGKRYLRLVFMSPETTILVVKDLIDSIRTLCEKTEI
ncbi:pyridoxal phosphate-dependent decarboxylase family protein [Poritiphilus flavus]|uniref:Diaminobutyrate decarboxylase n=1 Tax=Poritiphilus flavus TaxID=2697053 RepID=A0A6L9E921_9FLAO|nr:pyridoxal-dependent decarboxylase [Poritiphilus flavus]NAS11245.1 diaminobutyrate decarboxylase [Poritiphilus flavus]